MFRQISLSLEILIDTAKRNYLDTRLESDRRKKVQYAQANKKRKDLIDVSALVALSSAGVFPARSEGRDADSVLDRRLLLGKKMRRKQRSTLSCGGRLKRRKKLSKMLGRGCLRRLSGESQLVKRNRRPHPQSKPTGHIHRTVLHLRMVILPRMVIYRLRLGTGRIESFNLLLHLST